MARGVQPAEFPDVGLHAVGSVFLLALAVSAGLPYRFSVAIGPFPSVATVDLILAAGVLVLAWNWLVAGSINVGDRLVVALLAVPLCASALSVLWTQDVGGTLRSMIICLECMIAYLLVVEIGSRQSRAECMRQLQVLTLLLIIPGVLMWFRVPGFAPQVVDADEESLIAYYARFGHPFLGKSNDLAGVLAFLLFLLGAWVVLTRRFIDGLLAFLCAVALTATLSRGVLLAVLLSTVGVALTSVRGFVWLSVLLALFFAVTALVLGYLSEAIPIVGTYLEDRLSITNIEARTDIFSVAVSLIDDRPWLGAGAGAGAAIESTVSAGVHNTFIEQMLAFGLPLGVLVGVALVAVPFRLALIEATGRAATVFRYAAVAALCGQLLTFLTQTSFEASIPRILFYMLVGYSVLLVKAPPGDESFGTRNGER